MIKLVAYIQSVTKVFTLPKGTYYNFVGETVRDDLEDTFLLWYNQEYGAKIEVTVDDLPSIEFSLPHNCGYDGFGEPLRDSLETLIEFASSDIKVQVVAYHRYRGRSNN